MASDNNQMVDAVSVDLNPTEPIPDRPADSATKGKWVDYVVALGADREYAGDLTQPELVEFADRIGG